MKNKGNLRIRFSVFGIGLLVMAFGLDLFITSDLGASPWDVLHVGLFHHFGLSIGSWSIIAGFFILVLSATLMKEWPKLGAFLNMLLVGIFMDLLFRLPFMATPPSFEGKLAMFGSGLIINGIGMGIYISAQLGAGPRDSFMLAVHLKTGWKISHVRRGMEIIVLMIGWLMGGPVSYGTIIVSLVTGTIIGYTLPASQKATDACIAMAEKRKEKKVINRGEML
ncbi:YczE/YyaS/YitT family protein [Heyndrickxia acidicola]|uniref:YitT family protein n=1 Tax=Heyndrickxia acidicola TaxID=209389 RepID=A0ABU6MJ99_9BACI|nr:YitT family protein [Heyndrickxia acidicola]MED1204743.1 YitT family protein [Heyndrickxia acidicola]